MKYPHLALMISSYGRVPDLLRQVYAMAYEQEYQNTTICLSVKGLTEYTVNQVILPHLSSLISRGKVKMRIDGNTNQTWNILDTIRDEDLDSYDLFLKIDDDDFYHPKYTRWVAEGLLLGPKGSSTYVTGNFPTCKPDGHIVPTFAPGCYFPGWGDLLGMGRKVIDHLFEVEESYDKLMEDYRKFKYQADHDLGAQEDRYFFSLMKELTTCLEISPLMKGTDPVIVGEHTQQNSIMRGLYKNNPTFFNTVRIVRSDGGYKEREYRIEDTEGNQYRLFRGIMTDIETKEERGYVFFNSQQIVFPSGKVVKKEKDGRYRI